MLTQAKTWTAATPDPGAGPLPRWLAILAAVSLIPLILVLWASPHRLAPVYYSSMLVLGWLLLGQGRWQRLAIRLQRLPGPVWLRFLVLGYGAVVAEEMIVGTTFALAEGAGPQVWLARMGQFIALNLLAFSGAIWGLGIAYGRWPQLRAHHVWLAGVWGLIAEGVWSITVGNPIAGAIIAGPTIAVYAIILAPAMLSLPAPRGPAAPVWQLPLVWLGMFALSVAPVALLFALRGAVPWAFPSCEYIAC